MTPSTFANADFGSVAFFSEGRAGSDERHRYARDYSRKI